MGKLTAIIVDDEYRIGQLISRLIHFQEIDVELLKIFDNSSEALVFILENHPDIVISDIQMPVIDGLELIRHVHESQFFPHFILISGYKEFEYARTALKYGVEDYLLKPVNETELNQILKKVCSEHNQMLKEKEETRELKETAKREHILGGREALLALMQENYPEKLETFNFNYKTSLQSGDFLLFGIKLDYEADGEDVLQNKFLISTILSIFEDAFRNHVYEQLYAPVSEDEMLGLLNTEFGKWEEAEEALKKIFPEVANKVSSIHGYYATMAISDRCSFWSIPSAKSTVDERILQRYCYGVDRVISGTKIIPHEHQQILESKLKSRIAFATTSFDIPELQKLITEAFQSLTDLKLEEAYLIPGLAYDFTDCVFSNYSPTDEMRAEKARIFQTIDHCWSLEKITETLKKEISDVVADQERQHRMQTRKPVREAIEYIGNHYKEKITLDSICDQLQMNSSYFSTLFKKETGENFQNYLTNFRIEKAKELLVTTQNTMGAVAAEVGYADVRYFSQCFAKIVGMKPSLYRKMYS